MAAVKTWLYHRLCEVLDDCLYYNPSDKPMWVYTDLFRGQPGYGDKFGTGLDLSDPYFNLGGVILGHLAAFPQVATVFSLIFQTAGLSRVPKI